MLTGSRAAEPHVGVGEFPKDWFGQRLYFIWAWHFAEGYGRVYDVIYCSEVTIHCTGFAEIYGQPNVLQTPSQKHSQLLKRLTICLKHMFT
jgi:hypothetical protein